LKFIKIIYSYSKQTKGLEPVSLGTCLKIFDCVDIDIDNDFIRMICYTI